MINIDNIKIELMNDSRNVVEDHFSNFINIHDRETQLLIHTDNNQFIISMLFLKNKHKGIGSKVINACIAAARNAGYKMIVLESVVSAAIIHIANKLNFKPVDGSTLFHDNKLIGNYALTLN